MIFCFWPGRDTVRLKSMMPDLPNSMAETTQDCSSADNIFSNLDADLRPLGPSSPDKLVGPSSPAVSTDPKVIVISPPNSPVTYLSNPASTDGQHSPDSTSTIEASENDIIIEIPSLADIELLANNSNEEQHELPPAYPLPTDSSPVLSRPNQFKHRTETANLSIAANTAENSLLQNLQQLSGHGSTPVLAMAWNQNSTHGKLSSRITNEKNWPFRIHPYHLNDL